jgi:hypothetical protein
VQAQLAALPVAPELRQAAQFRAGKREGEPPYNRLGLALSTVKWWELLETQQLQQQLPGTTQAA